jgi:hypothetical protein
MRRLMPGEAQKAFDENSRDVGDLIKLLFVDVGKEPGKRRRAEVLNKSTIVLITSYWETFCEDLATAALEHMVLNTPDAGSLAKGIRKRIAKDIKEDKDELAVWGLADNGWRDVLKKRLSKLQADRNWHLNTPNAENIDRLFLDSIGLPEVSKSWHWQRMSVLGARAKLDRYVRMRGSIAHRGRAGRTVRRSTSVDYMIFSRRLVHATGEAVNKYVKATTGKALW